MNQHTVIASAILAVAIVGAAWLLATSHRFEVTAMGGTPVLMFVTDHWTGNTKYCDAATPADQLTTNGHNFYCYELSDPVRTPK